MVIPDDSVALRFDDIESIYRAVSYFFLPNRPTGLLVAWMEELPTTTRIILAAEELMLSKGFHEVGLNEILKAVGVAKGSFYHHFSSKEDFGVQMLNHYINEHTEERKSGFSDPEYGANAIERIFGFWQSRLDLFIEHGCECPCLLLKLTAEVGESSELMRNAIADGLNAWQSLYEEILIHAIDEGLIDPSIDVAAEALYLQNYWYGAIQHSMTIRDSSPGITALKQLRHHFTVTLAVASS